MLVEDLERVLGELCPWSVAESWDNVGLLVGRRASSLQKVLVCLDATEEVVVEAVTGDYGAVVSHHPLLFAPLRRVTDGDRVGIIVNQLISADVALFACHTNLDGAVGGLCEIAAAGLGLVDVWPLEVSPVEDVRSHTGAGRVGRVRTTTSLLSLAQTVAECFGMREAVYAGDPARVIDRVAVVTGSGTSLMAQAAAVADVLITGDVTYHDAERAADLGVALIAVPHGLFESWAMRRWTLVLHERLQTIDGAAAVFSTTARSPWKRAHPVSPDAGPDEAPQSAETGEASSPADRGGNADDGPFVLRVDGGSRGNPGPAAIGVVLEDARGNVLEALGARIGKATNNVAEYQALITGLETAIDRGIGRLRVLSDSELLVKQLRLEYKVRADGLKELFLQARSLLLQFERVEIRHVPREENTAADVLVNQALDGKI